MIENEVFLIPVPSGIDTESYTYLKYQDKSGFSQIQPSDIIGIQDPIVTWELAESLRNQKLSKCEIAVPIIDLESLAKHFFGLPSKEFTRDLPWSLFCLLREQYTKEEDLIAIYRVIKGLKSSSVLKTEDLQSFIQKIANRYYEIKKTMIERVEWERFEEIEIPIYSIFFERSLSGIKIDLPKADEHLAFIDEHHFFTLSKLREVYKYPAAELSLQSVKSHLDLDDKQFSSSWDIYSYIKDRRHLSEMFEMLHSAFKNQRAKKELLHMILTEGDRVYPIFDISGTVTSRILTSSINLQNIGKKFRDVITPDEGKSLLYLDYSCFEPSILGCMSKDPQLLELCRTDDMYSQMAINCGFNTSFRKQFKILFLAFSFGMDQERLLNFVSEILNLKMQDAQNVYDKMFGGFVTLGAWKDSIWQKTLKNGYAETIFGNRRYRKNKDLPLSNNEKRWSINQTIQGTASYILKCAILDMDKTFGKDVEFLLPMHDAILIQAKSDFIVSQSRNIQQSMITTFSKILDGVPAKVAIDEFHIK